MASTLSSFAVMRAPPACSHHLLRPIAAHDHPPSCSGVAAVVVIPLKGASRRRFRNHVRCSVTEHGAAARRFSLQLGLSGRSLASNARCQAQINSADVGVVGDSNGGFVKEEVLPKQQNYSDSREFRLQSVRGADYVGATIASHIWEWRHRWNIHYECAGMENTNAPAMLLLPGFGVGSFHYHQQLRDLGQEYRVWAIDFLGQGKSWPSHDPAPEEAEEVVEEVLEGQVNSKKIRHWSLGKNPEPWAEGLVYSVDTWRDQVHAFIEKVIGGPVYIVGNSLGGYVGSYFAATNPELVKGVTLLNATPFWAFTPNSRRYPLLSKLTPWGGLLPVPIFAKAIIRFWWDLLRNPSTIRNMLGAVYANRSAINKKLITQIIEATDHPAAFAAFASIVFAPRAHTDFGENLISLKERRMPMCMIYGKEDPWVVPFWGQRAKQRNPDAIYYELSPAGHCPHHEAPEVLFPAQIVLLACMVQNIIGKARPLFKG
uniref:AB hydrolase-1 domain-containing protein n=1 Tax=Physcomitrium patens TaxID=3218 RepID=A0A7I4D1T7_PHYPA